MMTDLAGNQIQFAIETSASASNFIRSGKVKALAVTSPKRSAAFPELPTMDEAGVKGCEIVTWYGLVAPHGLPKAVLTRIQKELAAVLARPDVRKGFEDAGVDAGGPVGDAFASFIHAENAKWAKVVKQSGASID